MAMCDRIAVMNDGVLVQVGTPSEIYEAPASPFVANFIGTANLLTGTIADGVIDFGFAEVDAGDLPEREDASVAVRPDDFRVGSGPIQGTVTNVFYLGEKVQTIVELPDGTELTLELDRRRHDLAPGETLALSIDTSNVHLIDA